MLNKIKFLAVHHWTGVTLVHNLFPEMYPEMGFNCGACLELLAAYCAYVVVFCYVGGGMFNQCSLQGAIKITQLTFDYSSNLMFFPEMQSELIQCLKASGAVRAFMTIIFLTFSRIFWYLIWA